MAEFDDLEFPARGYSLVRRLSIETGGERDGTRVVMDLLSDNSAAPAQIRLQFLGVANLALRDAGGGAWQILGLAVEDIRDRQWDRLNYRVFDAENQVIEFLCAAYAVSCGEGPR